MRVIEKDLPYVDTRKGRFRDDLKVTVRNAVITQLRRGARLPVAIADLDPAGMPHEPEADAVWMDQWRTCILDRRQQPDISSQFAVFCDGRRPAPPVPFAGVFKRVDVDHCELVGRGLHDIAVVIVLDELGPLGGRASRG